MRRGAMLALGLALTMGLAIVARGAEPEDDAPAPAPKASGNWFTRLFGGGSKTPAPKEDSKITPEQEEARRKAARQAAAAQRAHEETTLLRRQAVCLKLRTIAAQTNNDDLHRQADALDERAWNLYLQHTGRGSDGPGASVDEATLERHLGGGSGRPAAAAGAQAADGRAASRGDYP